MKDARVARRRGAGYRRIVDGYKCQPVGGPVEASVSLPGSKSLTNRALVVSGLAEGTSILERVLFADDTRLMIDALRSFGIAITTDEESERAEITGCAGAPLAPEEPVLCGNAGTVMRFCTALAALCEGSTHLDGVARMRERPIGALTSVLGSLGIGIDFDGEVGFPPVVVHGQPLIGGHVSMGSPPSSQLVSALLMIAPFASRDMLIEVTGDVPSVPYLRMTTRVMGDFGIELVEQYDGSGARFIVPSGQSYTARTLTIEPDASNATYFLAAAAVTGGRVTVEHLGSDSVQGDALFANVLGKMGCGVEQTADSTTVTGPADGLRGIDIDLNDMPDVAQTLAVVALFAEGVTNIRNVANLRVKETDRIAALAAELRKLGASVDEREDGLSIEPPETPRAAAIETYDDHRMAMSFAVAGLRIPALVIRDPGCCSKTFPSFFAEFERATRGG